MFVPHADGAPPADFSGVQVAFGIVFGLAAYFMVRVILRGFYTVEQSVRAVKTSFGRAERVGDLTTHALPMGQTLSPDERPRYSYPQLRVIPPGGPYFKWPWQTIHKVSVATQTTSIAFDPVTPEANRNGTLLDAVTKDHLNTGLVGQIRYRVSEQNLYAYIFGVYAPVAHVLGYFVSVLRERIANFEQPGAAPRAQGNDQPSTEPGEALALDLKDLAGVSGVSINDLRKNLRVLNEQMDRECASSEARYGIVLDACLITAIDPPAEVESALAAINTAHNHVSSEISLAQASADQRIVLSKRAVEIETLRAKAEVEPLLAQARELALLKAVGPNALATYLRNVRLSLYTKAARVLLRHGGGVA